jgi:hypothetical protein
VKGDLQYLRIGDEAFWDQDFYKVYKQNAEKHDLVLVFEVNEAWLDGISLTGDNASDTSKRNFLKQFNQ